MPKLFPQYIIEKAFARAKAQCECEADGHGHSGRCPQKLVKPMQGGKSPGAWAAHFIDPDGEPDLDNCKIMCMACHKASL